MQFFRPLTGTDYVLGAVGALQFDVTVARLKGEYGVDAVYEPVGFSTARWIDCEDRKKLKEFANKHTGNVARDAQGRLTYLAPNAWRLGFVMEDWPHISFHKTREQN